MPYCPMCRGSLCDCSVVDPCAVVTEVFAALQMLAPLCDQCGIWEIQANRTKRGTDAVADW